MGRYRIRRLPVAIPSYDAVTKPYGLWDSVERCYVDKYGRPDPEHGYWCSSREVAVMRRRDLNAWSDEVAT